VTRIVNSGNDTLLQSDGITACFMVDLDFASGHVYLSDGISEIVYAGNTYLPTGQFGGIDAVDETLDGTPRPVTLVLSGLDASTVATARDEVYKNRSATIYLAGINATTGQLVDVPEVVWEGRMNKMTLRTGKGLGSIALSCENRMRREPRVARYTDADQQFWHAGDKFFSFQNQMLGFVAQWGNDKVSWAGPTRTTPTGTPGYPGWPGYGPGRGHG